MNHHTLHLKIKHEGDRGKLLNWMKDYLHRRTQRVVIESKLSNLTYVKSGVSQSIVLGLLLFLIYINDLSNIVKSKLRLFADDSIVYNRMSPLVDCELLQKVLGSSTIWSKIWNMMFSTDKSKINQITNKKNVIRYKYKMNDTTLKSSN